MAKAIFRKLSHFLFPICRDNHTLIAMAAAVLCAVYCFSSALNTTRAGFVVNTSVQSDNLEAKNFSAVTVNAAGDTVDGGETVELKKQNTATTYTISGTGTATVGYCIVSDGTTTRYLYPIYPDTSLQVELTAAAGSTVTFTSGWGDPMDSGVVEDPDAVVYTGLEAPAAQPAAATYVLKRSAARASTASPKVELTLSETPSHTYTVPERVTLNGIAGFYGVTPEDILIFNGLDSADSIVAGATLEIPNPKTEAEYAPGALYKVQEGDSLEKIAERFGVTIRSLCQWNNIPFDAASTLGVGMDLKIPILYQPAPQNPEPEASVPAETTPEETEETEATEATEATTPDPTEETEPAEAETTAPTTAEETEPAETETTAPAASEETEPAETQEPASNETEETSSEETKTDETASVNGVPLYFQGDYPDTLYGSGTVKTSGCSVTSLTMVANAVTGYDYTVDELADYFGGRAENNIERLEIGSKTLGLSFRRSENIDKTMEALQADKIAIVLMDGQENANCLFTDSQHFIVLTGLNEEGKIMVNDSNADNYSKWQLKEGFEKGFTREQLLAGYSGAWIYDRTLESLPARHSEPRIVKTQENLNYLNDSSETSEENKSPLTEQERYLLACLIWGEAQGECQEGQQAVAEVVLNRLASGQFGDTIEQVICGEGQFRAVADGKLEVATPTQAQYKAIDGALYGTRILPSNIYYFSVFAGKADVYIQIGNHLFSFDEA